MKVVMKIYTGIGDEGKTRLFGGAEVEKDHLRLHVYGTLDELNSILGSGYRLRSGAEDKGKIGNHPE